MCSQKAQPAAAEPLLQVQPRPLDAHEQQADARGRGGRRSTPWLAVLGFLFLTFNSGMAVYRCGPSLLTMTGITFVAFNSAMAVALWNRDMGAMSFGMFFILDLALLFYCLGLYKRSVPGSPRREHLKMALWLLITMLTFAIFALLEFSVAHLPH